MQATFAPHGDARLTILKPAVGHALTVTLPSGNRVVLIVSNRDHDKVDQRQERLTVTDLITGQKHKLVRSDCGLGCRCGIAFEEA